ncbi:HU family DNA-binding protein [Balneatrix alpica]|uniref:HU family DNA-binding protein n=1 Tax=Balneatrix alpica TaxID=75684 RepID=UPI002738B7DB|nr:HU family DNA-binding protein [Balneatrix alpica]
MKQEASPERAGRSHDAVIESPAAGDEVALIGFGVFKAKGRAARTGRNPRTGQEIEIPATTIPTFKPGKLFKDALNS